MKACVLNISVVAYYVRHSTPLTIISAGTRLPRFARSYKGPVPAAMQEHRFRAAKRQQVEPCRSSRRFPALRSSKQRVWQQCNAADIRRSRIFHWYSDLGAEAGEIFNDRRGISAAVKYVINC